jgi:hypothetical protein
MREAGDSGGCRLSAGLPGARVRLRPKEPPERRLRAGMPAPQRKPKDFVVHSLGHTMLARLK